VTRGKPNREAKLQLLGRLGEGDPRRLRGETYELDGYSVHARYCATTPGRKSHFSFNINQTSLAADYELWLCGDTDVWYLLPAEDLRRIYEDPDAYVAADNPTHRVVEVLLDRDELGYAKGGRKADISEFRSARLPGRASTVGQPLAFNPTGWRRPVLRASAGASWVKVQGWACEDWNLALDRSVEGSVYGFGEGRLSEKRRQAAQHDLVLYYRDAQGAYRLVAVYRNAAYLHEEDADAAWEILVGAGEIDRRCADLHALFKDRSQGEAAVATYLRDAPIRWKVSREDVIVFEDQPEFRPPGKAPWRHGNAYDWRPLRWWQLPLKGADQQFHEGRLIEELHLRRERSSEMKSLVAARREQLRLAGRLRCEACDFDFDKAYTDGGDCLEGHHTRPLGELPAAGALISPDEVRLLCPNCHRVAHGTGRVTLDELREAVAAGPEA
jgi:hypothetical protein